MHDALVDGAIAEEGDGDLVRASLAGGHGGADGEGDAGADDAVGAEHALGHVRDVHGAALALVGAGGALEDLGHHAPDVDALGDAVAVAAVGGGEVVGVGEVGADAGGDGLLADGEVEGAAQGALADLREGAELEVADGHHGGEHLAEGFLGDFHAWAPVCC